MKAVFRTNRLHAIAGLLAALIGGGVFLLLLSGVFERVYAQCETIQGCWYEDTNFACVNRTCYPTSLYPGGAPNCTSGIGKGSSALFYDAIVATYWYYCEWGVPGDPDCTEANDTCANTNLYRVTPCNQNTACGTSTIDACVADSGSQCGM